MSYEELWEKFIAQNPDYKDKDYSVYNYEDAELLDIMNGKKVSEESLYDSYISAKEPLPVKGDVAVILDLDDNAKCIIEDISIELKTFASARDKDGLRATAEDEGLKILDESTVVVEGFKVIFK